MRPFIDDAVLVFIGRGCEPDIALREARILIKYLCENDGHNYAAVPGTDYAVYTCTRCHAQPPKSK